MNRRLNWSPVLVCGFIAHYVQDFRLARRVALPRWYLPLRLQLSAVACVCLSASLLLGQTRGRAPLRQIPQLPQRNRQHRHVDDRRALDVGEE